MSSSCSSQVVISFLLSLGSIVRSVPAAILNTGFEDDEPIQNPTNIPTLVPLLIPSNMTIFNLADGSAEDVLTSGTTITIILIILIFCCLCCCIICIVRRIWSHRFDDEDELSTTVNGHRVELGNRAETDRSIKEFDRAIVAAWLGNDVGLSQYFELFIQNGYETMKAIKTIQSKEELFEMGIDVLGHQTMIMYEITRLKEQDRKLAEPMKIEVKEDEDDDDYKEGLATKGKTENTVNTNAKMSTNARYNLKQRYQQQKAINNRKNPSYNHVNQQNVNIGNINVQYNANQNVYNHKNHRRPKGNNYNRPLPANPPNNLQPGSPVYNEQHQQPFKLPPLYQKQDSSAQYNKRLPPQPVIQFNNNNIFISNSYSDRDPRKKSEGVVKRGKKKRKSLFSKIMGAKETSNHKNNESTFETDDLFGTVPQDPTYLENYAVYPATPDSFDHNNITIDY